MSKEVRIVKTMNQDSNQSFNKALFSLVLPIALQNLISAAAIAVDVLMLGFVSQSAMSAVSLAGQITFVLTLFYMGMTTGSGILTAQYWGKKDSLTIERILSIASIFSLGISILFFALSFCFPVLLMQLFTKDKELIAYGTIFLRSVSFSYLAMGVSQIYLSLIKSMENARFSAWVSSICLILNITLNALCVFVLFPDKPENAIMGVAIATVFSRMVELGCCIVHSTRKSGVRFSLPVRNDRERQLLRDFIKYTLPIQGNYFIWGGAITVTTIIIGHVNTDMVAANSIATVVKNLAIVFCGGIASGGAVLVGKYLGSNDKEMAREAGKRIVSYSIIFGLVAGGTILLLKPLVFQLVALNDTAQVYLNGMLYICVYYCIGKSVNSTIISGIFPAGGDTTFGLWCDTIVMWIIILPLCYWSAFVWQVHPIILYAIISLDEIIKLPLAALRYRRFRWLTNITSNAS